MEERESTFSGSAGNSETESPPVTQMVNMPRAMAMAMDVNMSSENNTTTTTNNTTNNNTIVSTTTAQVLEIAAAAGVGSVDLSGKKKRGRPRKYDADGNLRLGYNSSINNSNTKSGGVVPPPPGFYISSPSSEFSSSSKRGRGRPPGSGSWQILASLGEFSANTAGGDFTPHVVTVSTGEDVAGKIFSFSQKGPRGVCVLSANGAVSNVTIRQPGSSGGILTYEGRFELLSLSGSFTVTEIGGVRSRTGGLSVSLAGPDGRVIGGGIAGLLTAASPIQIVIGSFMPSGYKTHKRKHQRENTASVVSPISGASDTVTEATPISQAQPNSETRLKFLSPLPTKTYGEAEKSMIQMQTSNAIITSAVWNTELKSEHRPSPDINVSVPVYP